MIKIKIDKLRKAKWNYKTNDEYLMGKLKENMIKNNQIENLIVREVGKAFEVVNGNHRLDAMKSIGWSDAWCYNLGKISLIEAKRIAIETNETRFKSDGDKLASLLSDINKDFSVDDMLSTLPYSFDELNGLLQVDDFDYDEYLDEENEDISKRTAEKKKGIMSISITASSKSRGIVKKLEQVVAEYDDAVLKVVR